MDVGLALFYTVALALGIVPLFIAIAKRSDEWVFAAAFLQMLSIAMLYALTRHLYAQQADPLLAWAAGVTAQVVAVMLLLELVLYAIHRLR